MFLGKTLDKLSILDIPRFERNKFGAFWCTVVLARFVGKRYRDMCEKQRNLKTDSGQMFDRRRIVYRQRN
jgi:hypothetical protein